MRRILSVGLSACLAGCSSNTDNSQSRPDPPPEELILAVRADSAETSAALIEMLKGKTLSLGPRTQRYSMANVVPDPSTDLKIRFVQPDPSIDYKILRVDPGESAHSLLVTVLDPASGQVLPNETVAVRSLVDRMARLKLLERFYQGARTDTGALRSAPDVTVP